MRTFSDRPTVCRPAFAFHRIGDKAISLLACSNNKEDGRHHAPFTTYREPTLAVYTGGELLRAEWSEHQNVNDDRP
jgi:hypothetical protein